MNKHSKQPSNGDTKLELKDPQQRDAKQLLESAKKSRSENRLAEAVILAYLALKASKAEQNATKSTEAVAHLFLSEAMGGFGYRAMERIHAKAAYRALQRNASATPDLEPGPFYFRLGVVATEGGDYSVAGYYLKRALAAYEAVEPPNSKAVISTLLELARLSLKQADVQRSLEQDSIDQLNLAQEYVDRAMTLTKDTSDDLELVGAIHDVQAQMILRLSSHLPTDKKGLTDEMLAKAEKMLRASLDRRRLNPRCTLHEQLPIMNELVSILRRTGRFVEAMDVVEEILNITDQLQRIDVDIVLNMMLVSKNLANDNLTRTLCEIVMRSEEARIAEVSSMSSEALALAFFSTQSRYRSMKCLAVLSTSGAVDDNNARLILDLVLRRKAIITDAQSAFWETLHGQSDTDLSGARANLISLRNRLGTKMVTGDAVGLWPLIQQIEHGEEVLTVEPWWRALQGDGADAERQALQGYAESIIKGMSPWEAISPQRYQFEEQKDTVDMVAKHLPRDTVLVEFVRIDDFDLERDVFLETAHYWALILHPDGRNKAIDLGDAAQIEREITSNLKALHSGDRLLPEPQLQAVSKLYDVAWSPFANELKKVNNVILSPDAVFAFVPFGALLAPDGRFLIEHLTLYQIATGRELAEKKQASRKKSNRPVIIADPDFDASSGATSKNHRRKSLYFTVPQPLARLEATYTEGQRVRELLGDDVEFVTRKDASEGKVRTFKSPRVFHLATHGLFFEAKTSPEQDLSEEDAVALDAAYVRHVQALSRSGIALSGINRGGWGSDDDGLLTAFDVAGMDLSGTDLVVLSACETGLGDVLAGEGVLGLRRSFRIAGSQFVLMSLWRLSDKEAVRQMRAFYTAYSAGKNPVLALRDTQRARILRLREVLGHAPPALWGALTIQGLNI